MSKLSRNSSAASSSNQLVPDQTKTPNDRYHLIYFLFFVMGLSTLLPWNFFTSLTHFWDYKFRDVDSVKHEEHKTPMQEKFTSYLAIAANIPNATFVILNAIYGSRIKLRWRLCISLSGVIFIFIAISSLAKVNSDRWQETFLFVILGLVVLTSVNSAIFNSAVTGVAGKFPYKYMGAVMIGQSIGGVAPPLLNVLIIYMNVPQKDIGFWLFLLVTFVLIFTLGMYLALGNSEFFLHYEEASFNVVELSEDITETKKGFSLSTVVHAVKESWHYSLSIFLVFTFSLSVYPALFVNLESQYKHDKNHKEWADKYFNLVCNFLLMNISDLAGRMLAPVLRVPGRSRVGKWICLGLTLSRFIFIPLSLMFNVLPDERTLPVWFPKDAEFIVFCAVMGLTNGYLSTICMIHGPKVVPDGDLQEKVAMILSACMVLGMAAGSSLSYPVLMLI